MKWLILAGAVLAAVALTIVIIGALLPKRHVVSRTILIHQPPQAIFDVISGAPSWRSDVKTSVVLPDHNGHACWSEQDKHGQTITYERTEYNPPKTMVTQIADKSLPFGGSWKYEVEPAEEGSRIRITESGEVYNPVFRFVSAFVIGHSATIERYLKDLGRKFGEQVSLEA